MDSILVFSHGRFIESTVAYNLCNLICIYAITNATKRPFTASHWWDLFFFDLHKLVDSSANEFLHILRWLAKYVMHYTTALNGIWVNCVFVSLLIENIWANWWSEMFKLILLISWLKRISLFRLIGWNVMYWSHYWWP